MMPAVAAQTTRLLHKMNKDKLEMVEMRGNYKGGGERQTL